MKPSNRPRRSGRAPRMHLCLPPLSGSEASALLTILDRAIDAIWRAHGPAIEEHRRLLFLAPPSSRKITDETLF